MDLNTLGSIASLVGVGTTLLQWLTQVRQDGKQATIDEYLEWLRRQNHQEILSAIERTAGMLGVIESLIRDVSQKTDALPDVLEPLITAAQTAILAELAQSETRIVVQLAQLGDMLKLLQDNSQSTKKVPDPKPEFEIQPGTVLRTTVVRTSPREAQFGVDLSLINRRTTMTTVVSCQVLLEYVGAELLARVRLRGNLVLPRHGGAVQVRAETPLVSDVGVLPKLVEIRVKTIQDGDLLLRVDQELWDRLYKGK